MSHSAVSHIYDYILQLAEFSLVQTSLPLLVRITDSLKAQRWINFRQPQDTLRKKHSTETDGQTENFGVIVQFGVYDWRRTGIISAILTFQNKFFRQLGSIALPFRVCARDLLKTSSALSPGFHRSVDVRNPQAAVIAAIEKSEEMRSTLSRCLPT